MARPQAFRVLIARILGLDGFRRLKAVSGRCLHTCDMYMTCIMLEGLRLLQTSCLNHFKAKIENEKLLEKEEIASSGHQALA